MEKIVLHTKILKWTDTLKDHVYAKTEEEALKKFDKRHPDRKVRYVSNWVTADY